MAHSFCAACPCHRASCSLLTSPLACTPEPILPEDRLIILPHVQTDSLVVQDEKQNWRIQAVSKSPGSFENRLSLPAAWQGLRDEELSSVSGIPGGIFVHASGFIGGNKTHDGVKAMASAAVEQTSANGHANKKARA